MDPLSTEPGRSPFAVGDGVRISRTLPSAKIGSVGTVIGFFRRDPETIAVKLVAGVVVQVTADDLEPLDRPVPGDP